MTHSGRFSATLRLIERLLRNAWATRHTIRRSATSERVTDLRRIARPASWSPQNLEGRGTGKTVPCRRQSEKPLKGPRNVLCNLEALNGSLDGRIRERADSCKLSISQDGPCRLDLGYPKRSMIPSSSPRITFSPALTDTQETAP